MTNTINKSATILIVDDNADNLEMLFQYFERTEFKTLAAQNGETAIFQAQKAQPDLMLLDIILPDIDGFEVCRRLKANPSTHDIPVIFITALYQTEHKVNGFDAGGVDFITKPFHYEEVLARVTTHVTLKQQRRQLQEQAAALEDKNAQLQQLNASKDKFFSIVAHDLKQPFSSLALITHHLKASTARWDRTSIAAHVEELEHAVDPLYAFIENLLMWASMQQGMLDYRPQRLNLQFEIAKHVALVIYAAQQKRITINNAAREPIPIYADVTMLDAVMRNLLSNALKFTHPGGKVEIVAAHDDDGVTLAVSDTGIGIPPDTLADVFRIDAVTRRVGTADEQGTGLGLLLCREFVERHGGRIWGESAVGKGSTFRFTLPNAQESPCS